MATSSTREILKRLGRVAAANLIAARQIAERAQPRGRKKLSFRHVGALVGHELRAPVSAALLHLAIARRQADAGVAGDALYAALDIARSELQRLDGLVWRVTELLRDGVATIEPRWIDLGAAVREAVARVLTADPDMRSHLTVDVASGLAGWWDATAAEQIVQNLLANAGKFGAGQPIRVSVERVPIGARIVVRDRGRGISKHEQLRIFRRGFHTAASRNGGLGLGLWLVRELAEAHGGGVTVRSEPVRGAAFTVVLRQRAPSTGREPGRRPPQPSAPTRARTASTMAAAGARPSTGRSSAGSSSTGGS